VSSLEELYDRACNEVSDCFKHCPMIYELARKCESVTELGLNSKPIAISLLAAQPYKYSGYGEAEGQIKKYKKLLESVCGKTNLYLRQGHSLQTQIEPTDLLVIDTYHSSPRLEKELLKHAGNVKKFIVLPSTYAFAVRGEDGSFPGLGDVINDFVSKNEQWEVVYQSNLNNGVTVLEREPQDGPDFERMYSMVTYDIPDVRYIERYKIGMVHPSKDLTGEEIEHMAKNQTDALNRALRYGIVIGVERNFTTIKIDDKEILSGYLVYHVGFRNRPLGK